MSADDPSHSPSGDPTVDAPVDERGAASPSDASSVAPSTTLRQRVDQDQARIAVVETGFIGDVVFTSVLARSIRRAWPEAELVLVARGTPATLAKGLGFQKSIVFDKRDRDRGLRGVDRVVQSLESARCRALLVPHRSARSAVLSWRSKIFMRIGYTGDRLGIPLSGPLARFAFTHRVPFDEEQTFTNRLLRLLEPLEIAPSVPRPRYRPSVDSKTYATDMLADKGMGGKILISLAPASVWETKRWPIQAFAQLADAIVAADMIPLALGARSELPLLKKITGAMRYPDQLVDAFGTTLDQAAEMMRRSAVIVAGDTGLLHLGVAAGCRAVAIFGPTDPALHDLGASSRVLTVDLPCRPCSPHGQHICPLKHHDCMKKLNASDVVAATLALARSV